MCMKIILSITALLALSSISLLAADEDWISKYQRLGDRSLSKGANASAVTPAASATQSANASAAARLASGDGNSRNAEMSQVSSASAGAARSANGDGNSPKARMSEASSFSVGHPSAKQRARHQR